MAKITDASIETRRDTAGKYKVITKAIDFCLANIHFMEF